METDTILQTRIDHDQHTTSLPFHVFTYSHDSQQALKMYNYALDTKSRFMKRQRVYLNFCFELLANDHAHAHANIAASLSRVSADLYKHHHIEPSKQIDLGDNEHI